MNNYPSYPPPVRKRPSSVISWLGFGISLGTLLTIIILTLLESSLTDDIYASTLLSILLMMTIGVLGLIFSIIGVFLAIKNSTPKWMSVCGIIFCCLYLPMLFLSAMVGISNEQEITTEQSVTETDYGLAPVAPCPEEPASPE